MHSYPQCFKKLCPWWWANKTHRCPKFSERPHCDGSFILKVCNGTSSGCCMALDSRRGFESLECDFSPGETMSAVTGTLNAPLLSFKPTSPWNHSDAGPPGWPTRWVATWRICSPVRAREGYFLGTFGCSATPEELVLFHSVTRILQPES